MRKKPLLGYEGVYSVTNSGKVYSHHFKRYLKSKLNSHGREIVYIGRHMKQVSRLVALTFVPNPYDKPQVNHIDGNRLNNYADNLEWVTSKENHAHAFRLGLRVNLPSMKAHTRKLTIEQVKEIRNSKENQYELAKRYGVVQSTISRIKTAKAWR